jgi:hypothetical protein
MIPCSFWVKKVKSKGFQFSSEVRNFSPQGPESLCGPLSLVFSEYRGPIAESNAASSTACILKDKNGEAKPFTPPYVIVHAA